MITRVDPLLLVLPCIQSIIKQQMQHNLHKVRTLNQPCSALFLDQIIIWCNVPLDLFAKPQGTVKLVDALHGFSFLYRVIDLTSALPPVPQSIFCFIFF